jgi:hypothetical protein
MCCLGFLGKQLGVPYTKMTDKPTPENLTKVGQAKFQQAGLLVVQSNATDKVVHTDVCDRLIVVNDDLHLTEQYREKRITALFKRIGIKVRFIGK